MKIVITLLKRLLKPGLLIYEVFRVLVLGALLVMQPSDVSYSIRMIFAIQGVLFPLMALFLNIDEVRYREYIPLFIAGKAIGIIILLSFSLLSREITEFAYFARGMLLVSLDLFALAVILIIKKNIKISEPVTETGTEVE